LISGETERLFRDLEADGLNERDVISRASGLLNLAYRSDRLAIAAIDSHGLATGGIESIISAKNLEEQQKLGKKFSEFSQQSTSKNGSDSEPQSPRAY
jgi:hypothetical protein